MQFGEENYEPQTPKSKVSVSVVVLIILIFVLLLSATIISTTKEVVDDGEGGYKAPIADDTALTDGERVSYSAQQNGTISKSATYTEDDGTVVTEYTVRPQSGYMINSLSIDGTESDLCVAQGDPQKLTFASGTGNHSISVSFEKIYIVLSANDGDAVNVTVKYGENVGTGEDARPATFVLKAVDDTAGVPTHEDTAKEFYYFSSVATSNATGLNGGKRYDLGITYNLPAAVSTTLFATFLTPTANWHVATTNLVVPNGVEEIVCDSNYSGQNCNLLNVTLDNTVRTITLPASATLLSDNAFRNCEALERLIMSDYTRIIGTAVFSNTSIREFNINEENRYYSVNEQKLLLNKTGTRLLCAPAYGSDDTVITLPATLSEIEPYAFSGSPSANVLVESGNTSFSTNSDGLLLSADGTKLVVCPKGKSGTVTLPSSVTEIEEGALQCCKYVQRFDLSLCGVTSLSALEFDGCSALVSVTLNAQITAIGADAFSRCTSLVTVNVPSGAALSSIGVGAFRGCSALTSITDISAVTSIAEYAFYGCSSLTASTFVLPAALTNISAHCFENCTSFSFASLPAGVAVIGRNAFAGCTSLGAVLVVPGSVTTIDEGAFYNCTSLTEIWLPASVTTLGNGVFGYCNSPEVYAAAASRPAGWSTGWDRNVGTVHWNS